VLQKLKELKVVKNGERNFMEYKKPLVLACALSAGPVRADSPSGTISFEVNKIVSPALRQYTYIHEIRTGNPSKRQHHEKTFNYEGIKQILAESNDLLQQIDPKTIKYLEEEQRAQLEQKAQCLKN
jgi:hypothetical protein